MRLLRTDIECGGLEGPSSLCSDYTVNTALRNNKNLTNGTDTKPPTLLLFWSILDYWKLNRTNKKLRLTRIYAAETALSSQPEFGRSSFVFLQTLLSLLLMNFEVLLFETR